MVTINLAAAFLVMAAVAVTVRAAAKAVARIVVRVAARAATNPLPLTGFYVTDYDHLVNGTINTSETWYGQTPLTEDSAFSRMCINTKHLIACGAFSDSGMPFNRVSGFGVSADDRANDTFLKNPSDLAPNKTLKLLMWGSPHPNASSSDCDIHGSGSISDKYKTEAFESMAWLCLTGTVIMTFHRKYRVEFYQPQYDTTAANRTLVVGQMYSREYIPMASGNGMRFAVPNAGDDIVMVAMLVPLQHFQHIVHRNDAIDVGATALAIMRSLNKSTEFGAALGVYDCSLEMELVLALNEQK